MTRALLFLVLLASTASAGDLDAIAKAVPACDEGRTTCIGIHVHVAAADAGHVVTPAWIAAQLAAANRLFAPLDVGFELAATGELPASAAHVRTRTDRNALGSRRLVGKVIHVFVVGRLDDVDVANETRFGVAWRRPKDRRKYIILSAQAFERVLAHELGHVFGLPHSTYAISIMNKSERKEPPPDQRVFADEEIAAMRKVLKRLLRDKVLVAVSRRPASDD